MMPSLTSLRLLVRSSAVVALLAGCGGCGGGEAGPKAAATTVSPPDAQGGTAESGIEANSATGALPLVVVSEVPLPGRSTRFDYQDVDVSHGHLILAHMNDGSVVIANLSDGAVVKELKGIPTARGVAVGENANLIFVTSSPDQLVLIDATSLEEVKRVGTGGAPDGVAWDSTHKMVGVSDQADGALSIIGDSGSGARKQVPLGSATGNVVFDRDRGWFWITAERQLPPDRLVAVDPTTAKVVSTIDLPGCSGAHGLRLHPDGKSAFIACEGNDKLARVDLEGAHAVATADTGAGPDVMSIDPGLGWIYVAAESGDLTVFDLKQPGVALVGHDHPGDHTHSVSVDPSTHRVFFPLMNGANGKPALRIMRPTGG
jgi:DNA-binding beta-propeller fold protein YncE